MMPVNAVGWWLGGSFKACLNNVICFFYKRMETKSMKTANWIFMKRKSDFIFKLFPWNIPQGKSGRSTSAAGRGSPSGLRPGTGWGHSSWRTWTSDTSQHGCLICCLVLFSCDGKLTRRCRRAAWTHPWIAWPHRTATAAPHKTDDLAATNTEWTDIGRRTRHLCLLETDTKKKKVQWYSLFFWGEDVKAAIGQQLV